MKDLLTILHILYKFHKDILTLRVIVYKKTLLTGIKRCWPGTLKFWISTKFGMKVLITFLYNLYKFHKDILTLRVIVYKKVLLTIIKTCWAGTLKNWNSTKFGMKVLITVLHSLYKFHKNVLTLRVIVYKKHLLTDIKTCWPRTLKRWISTKFDVNVLISVQHILYKFHKNILTLRVIVYKKPLLTGIKTCGPGTLKRRISTKFGVNIFITVSQKLFKFHKNTLLFRVIVY
jgi:hypothetical protein